MKLRVTKILFISVFLPFLTFAQATERDTLKTSLESKAQLSVWTHINPSNNYQLYTGARLIPQFNYDIDFGNDRLIDIEASANVSGSATFAIADSMNIDGNAALYRFWARYSARQFEIRAGLQKIDFGTAKILRSLRWFDQVDPRDPLQITNGVYGLLARYYFLDNTNIWLWGLYGNKNTKGMELINSRSDIPEYGGRIQASILGGESGISYHHRVADTGNLSWADPLYDKIGENRIGIDARWDMQAGFWFETSWVGKNKDLDIYTHQHLLTLGSDYTLGIGSGLNITIEHLTAFSGKKAFNADLSNNFTALSLMYPISIFDNLQTIIYYNWEYGKLYSFANWFRQFDHTTLYLMAYWNPENSVLPTGNGGQNLYGGAGVLLMYVINI